MNTPIDHHYLPKFLLARWAMASGRIFRYSKPYGNKIVVDTPTPKSTAFEPRLYDFMSSGNSEYRSVETELFSRIDNAASKVLELIENGLSVNHLTDPQRFAWAQLVISLLLRSPEDVAQLVSSVKEEWERHYPMMQNRYSELRGHKEKEDIKEHLRTSHPHHVEESI